MANTQSLGKRKTKIPARYEDIEDDDKELSGIKNYV